MIRIAKLFALAAVAAVASSALADDRVLVVPFNGLNVPSDQQWIPKAVQENLVADLGRTGGFDPIAFNTQVIVEDNATAARLGRTNNAPFAIRGSAQVIGDNIRITAQLIDVRSGDTLRTAVVTGNTTDLLKLEDDLANQIRGTPAAAPATAVATGAGMPVVPIIVQQPQPQVIVISQPEPVYYPNYSYPYYYNYGYPLVLYQVNPGHGHDHDHDGHGHDGHGGHDGGVQIVNGGSGNFNPVGLPIPVNNVLPIPTNNVLPIPTRNVQPLPTNNVAPIPVRTVAAPSPASAPPAPRTNSGRRLGPVN